MVLLATSLMTNISCAQNAAVGKSYFDQGFQAVQQSPLRVAQGLEESPKDDVAVREIEKDTPATTKAGPLPTPVPTETQPTETQKQSPAELERPAPVSSNAESVTLESIEAELEKVNALPDSSDPIFSEIKSLYQKAKLHVTETGALSGLLAQFQRAIETAPEQLEQTQALLNQTDGESKLPFNHDTPVVELPKLKELESQQLEKEIKLKTILKHIETSSPVQRQTRAKTIQEELTQALSQLEEVELQLKTPPANDNEFFTRARRTQLLAERAMLVTKIKTLETETDSYEATADLLAVQLEHDRKW